MYLEEGGLQLGQESFELGANLDNQALQSLQNGRLDLGRRASWGRVSVREREMRRARATTKRIDAREHKEERGKGTRATHLPGEAVRNDTDEGARDLDDEGLEGSRRREGDDVTQPGRGHLARLWSAVDEPVEEHGQDGADACECVYVCMCG